MPKEPITKTMKWLMAIGAFAVIGLLYFAYLDTNDQLELAGMRQWWPARHKSTKIPSDWMIYESTKLGLSFKYPPTWQIEHAPDESGAKNETYYIEINNKKIKNGCPEIGEGEIRLDHLEDDNLETIVGLEVKQKQNKISFMGFGAYLEEADNIQLSPCNQNSWMRVFFNATERGVGVLTLSTPYPDNSNLKEKVFKLIIASFQKSGT